MIRKINNLKRRDMKAKIDSKNKKKPVLTIIVIILVLVFGVLIGLILFSYGSDKKTPIKDFIEEAKNNSFFKKSEKSETVPGGDKIADSVPESGTYEGSEAEEAAKKEISEQDHQKLKDAIGEKGYVNKAYGYAFNPPKGWYPDPINSELSPFIYFTSYNPEEKPSVSEIEGVKLEVVVQSNPDKLSLDDWVAEGHTYMEPISKDKISIGQYEAYKEEVEYQGPMSMITFFKDQDVYTFAMYGKEEEYKKYKGEFEKVIESLIVL